MKHTERYFVVVVVDGREYQTLGPYPLARAERLALRYGSAPVVTRGGRTFTQSAFVREATNG